VERNGRYIVYTKESSVVEDLLVFIGAHNASLEIMNVKILKDIRNKVNRVTNFETANIDKTLSASKKQTDCINYLLKNMAPGYISDELYKTALLRIENPDATLKELCSMTEPPVSRSGMNHRLSKLCELSDALRKGGKKK
jgi:DNA-binding protein WhiA